MDGSFRKSEPIRLSLLWVDRGVSAGQLLKHSRRFLICSTHMLYRSHSFPTSASFFFSADGFPTFNKSGSRSTLLTSLTACTVPTDSCNSPGLPSCSCSCSAPDGPDYWHKSMPAIANFRGEPPSSSTIVYLNHDLH